MAAKRTLGRGRSKSRRSGFTLMEVLLVMAILVIMGTLVVANFSGILFKTKSKSAKIQLQAIGKALDLYQIDMNSYPDPNNGLFALQERPPEDTLGGTSDWGGPYMKKAIPKDPWGQDYLYELGFSDNDQQYYKIWSPGPNMQNENGDDGTDDIAVYSDR